MLAVGEFGMKGWIPAKKFTPAVPAANVVVFWKQIAFDPVKTVTVKVPAVMLFPVSNVVMLDWMAVCSSEAVKYFVGRVMTSGGKAVIVAGAGAVPLIIL